MKVCDLCVTAVLLALCGSIAAAADTTYMQSGKIYSWEVTKMSPTSITIKKGGLEETLAVNKIKHIRFGGEPAAMKSVRDAMREGRFEEVISAIGRIKATLDDGARSEVRQDVAFYEAYANGQLALGGSVSLNNAAKMMLNFVEGNRGNYHYLPACELLGDMATALGSYTTAVKWYREVGSTSPWPDYRMRALIGLGKAELAQKKHAAALGRFDSALKLAGNDPESQRIRNSAILGKASTLAATGKAKEGIRLVHGVLDTAAKDERVLHARAFVTLGNCYRSEGKSKDALIEFLKVDLLYNTHPASHAEALANLAVLWETVNKRDRAVKARNTLKSFYPRSRFATQGQ